MLETLKYIQIGENQPEWIETIEIYFDPHYGVTLVSEKGASFSLADFPVYRDKWGEIFNNPHFGHKVASVVKKTNRRR